MNISCNKYHNPDKQIKALMDFRLEMENDSMGESDRIHKKFSKIIKKYKLPAKLKNCKDGTYTFRILHSEPASFLLKRTYYDEIILEVKDNKITFVYYDENNSFGSKRNDPYYNDLMKNGNDLPFLAGNGMTADQIYSYFQKKLLEKQDLNEIDALTGATYSYYRFRTLCIYTFIKINQQYNTKK